MFAMQNKEEKTYLLMDNPNKKDGLFFVRAV